MTGKFLLLSSESDWLTCSKNSVYHLLHEKVYITIRAHRLAAYFSPIISLSYNAAKIPIRDWFFFFCYLLEIAFKKKKEKEKDL